MEDGKWTIRDEEDAIYVGKIGAGGYGEIHEIYDRERRQCIARKLIRPFITFTEADIANEVKAMNQLCRTSHPNIIQIFRHDKLHPNSEFYFIDMELCDCNLEEYIYGRKRPLRLMSWNTAIANGEGPFLLCVITLHIASGLKFVHENDQVHRDLNPQNILYSSKTECWMVADFGLTSYATTTRAQTTIGGRGKECYRPPELFVESKWTYNKMVDIWAFGCILYELITRQKAFESDFQVYQFASATAARDLTVTVEWLAGPVKERCDQLIRDTIHRNVQARPSAKIIHDRISMLVAEVFPGRIDSGGAEISHEMETETSLQLREDISTLNATIEEIRLESTTLIPSIEQSDMSPVLSLPLFQISHQTSGPNSETSELQRLESLVEDNLKSFGPHHRFTFASQLNLADHCVKVGRNAGAVGLYQSVIQRQCTILGEDDPSTLDAQKLFGANLRKMRRYKASVDLFESVLPRFERVFGATSEELMCAEYYLGEGYRNIGRHQEALNMLETTLNRHVEIVGDTDPRTFAVQCSLMKACFRLGRSAESVSMLESAVALIAKVPHNASIMNSQVGFAHMYFQLGRYVDMTKLLESVARGKLKTLVSYDVDVLFGQVLLAESYYLTKRFDEASALLFEGGLLARTKHGLGNTNPTTVRAIGVSERLRNYELHGMVFADSIPS